MNKQLVFLLFFLILTLLSTNILAQKPEIKGDTIFATNETDVLIRFPSNNIEAVFTDPSALKAYALDKAGPSVIITGLTDSGQSFPLVVNEGKRSHTFIVSYKKNIDLKNAIYDYSTVKLLQQRVKQIEARKRAEEMVQEEGASRETAKVPALLEEGEKAFDKGQFDIAELKLNEVLKIQPANKDALNEISRIKDIQQNIAVLKSRATKALNADDYDAALAFFNKVLSLNPNDFFAQSQVAAIGDIKSKIASIDSKADHVVNDLQTKGDSAFKEKRYDDAIAAYKQLSNLQPNNSIWERQIETIEAAKANFIDLPKDENFKTLVSKADKAFIDNHFEVARDLYLSAKTLRPKDKSVEEKLKVAEEKIAVSHTEDVYQLAVMAGDKAFKDKSYEKARTEYTRALDVFKDSIYPSQKIIECNQRISDLKIARERENNYREAVVSADSAFTNRDFSKAKNIYSEASVLKPGEVYPKNKLAEIDSIVKDIEVSKDLEIKFDSAMAQGDTAINKKDFNTAKTEFELASELKPTEQEPKDKLELISKLQIPAGENVMFDSAIVKGNIAISKQNYALALEYFKQASKIKPGERYPLSQLKYVQGMIKQETEKLARIQDESVMQAKDEIRTKRFHEAQSERAKFERAATVSDYVMELFYLKNFLNIIPDATELEQRQGDPNKMIEDLKLKIQQIRAELTKKNGPSFQAEAIPYLDVELEKKYENINFSTLPDGQKTDSVDSTTTEEYVNTAKELLLEKPYLFFSDSLNKVKISCVAIRFKKGEAFYKFNIQNRDTAEFLTGSLQESIVKNGNDSIKNNANYISAFPIVQQGKDFPIIYTAKDITISDYDVLSFQIGDRLKKYNFRIAIPGSVYNKEKSKVGSLSASNF